MIPWYWLLSYGRGTGTGQDIMTLTRGTFFYVPVPKYTNFHHKTSMYSSGKHFFSFLCKSFLQNFSSKLAKGMNYLFIWFFTYTRNSAYFPCPITLKLPKLPNSNYLKLTIKECTVLWSPFNNVYVFLWKLGGIKGEVKSTYRVTHHKLTLLIWLICK